MFENSQAYKKQDKICSISNFSSSENSEYLNEQEIAAQAQIFATQMKRNEEKRFYKPVFIITDNLQSKHINALTLLLEKNRVPVQFQHETQSLGQELNTRFFVVVDNKFGTLKLGNYFNSSLMTIVGYPKIGKNTQNIYCEEPEDVFSAYKEFVNAKYRYSDSSNDYQTSQIREQKTARNSGENTTSILKPELSGLKLKCISKYDKKKHETNQAKSTENKENLTSIRDLYCQSRNIHNLYFMESLNNNTYNDIISKYYHEVKLSTSKTMEDTVFYYRSENDLIKKLNEYNPFFSAKSMKGIRFGYDVKPNPNKLHFVMISSEAALKLATRINCEFYQFKNKIKFLVVMFNHETSQEDEQEIEKEMILIKKTIQSDLFQSLVCTPEECEKALREIGFAPHYDVPMIKVTPYSCKSILTKSNKKINGTEKVLKMEEEKPISEDMISFSPKLQNTVSINEDKNQKIVFASSHPKLERENNLMSQIEEVYPEKSSLSPEKKGKITIPPINSIPSPQKSTVSSNGGSKIKIIKVLKKEPSNLSSSKDEQKGKNISEINSEYCINQNKSIVEKMQERIASSSRRKIDGQGSNESIENHFKSTKKIPLNNTKSVDSRSSIHSRRSLSSSRKLLNRKSLKEAPKIEVNEVQNDYQCLKAPLVKNVKKMKLNLLNEEPFVARCSRVTCADEKKSHSSTQKIRKLKKEQNQTSTIPITASEYYFGSSLNSDTKWQHQPTSQTNENLINGLVHVEYNELITSIVNEFKENCPSSIIQKDSYRPFYLACEYSRQIKNIWRAAKHRGILPALIDIQGLNEIYKYYSNVMYEDDELQFYSTNQSKMTENNKKIMKNTGQFTVPAISNENTHMLLFFTIVTENQIDDEVFERLDWISERLPKHEVIKCVVEENMSDKEMKEKVKEIYNQIVAYFTELKEEYGDRFVQTL